MELAQVTQNTGGLALMGTALVLGIRHGIDWDHIAAISDITGTTTNVKATEPESLVAVTTDYPTGAAPGRGLAVGRPAGAAVPARVAVTTGPSIGRTELYALWLASLYALGHATLVALLGLAALYFQAILPEWLDPLMERVVGLTLVALGVWVMYSLVRYWRGEADFRLRSRWMLVFTGVRHAWYSLQQRPHGHGHPGGGYHVHRVDQYGPKTAFGIGVIHGIGAETGTQVLIIAAVGGAASQGLGTGMMLAFIAGLLISNTAVAVLTSLGFLSAGRAKALYVAVGCLTAAFSLFVGTYFVLGAGDQLPRLQGFLSVILGEPTA